MSRLRPRSNRPGTTLIEILLASGIMLLVLGLLWAGLGLVLRGAGKAEWKTQAERRFEAFAQILREELGRANHLIAVEPGGERVHEPRYAAVWLAPEGRGVRFRVFRADQEAEDPSQMDPEEFAQDQVEFLFLSASRQLRYTRLGNLEPHENRVLLEDVAEANFSAGSSYSDLGALGGILQVSVRLQQPDSQLGMTRELGIRLGVPVLETGVSPEGGDFLPPPRFPDPP